MFYLFLFFFNLINSSVMLFIFHPLAMGMILLMQTVLVCLITGLTLKTFWFSYILFLIFLGGLLVLFIYVTSLASNEMFKFSKFTFLFLTTMIMMSMIFSYFFDKSFFFSNFSSYDLMNLSQEIFFQENSLILNKLFNYPINIFTIILMIYLFLVLVAIVKITNLFEGPLRPKF